MTERLANLKCTQEDENIIKSGNGWVLLVANEMIFPMK